MTLHSVSRLRKEYARSVLDISMMNNDPVGQFKKWFQEAIDAGVPEPNAMVLSTVSGKFTPSARLVLLKGIDKRGFLFFTNYGSRKGREISDNPFCALTFHWKEIERQVRIEGRAVRLPVSVNREYFNMRPLDSRISACISPQSQVIPDRQVLEVLRDSFFMDLSGGEPECPADWGGFRVAPSMLEFWQGREHRLHDRIRYRKSADGWKMERLAP